MPITVRYRNLELVFSSLAEVDTFADEVEARKSKRSGEAQAAVKVTHTAVERSSLVDVVKGMNERQRELLTRVAVGEADGVKDSDLRDAMDMKNNQQLAGLIGGISKRLKASGYKVDSLIGSEKRMDGKQKYYQYWIQGKAVQDVVDAL